MDRCIADKYLEILKKELIPALGCTEPIAVALAAAKAREVLGCEPETICIYCSGNIIKNVKGVVVPNSGGKKGVETAAAIGALGGDPNRGLEVLSTVGDAHREKAAEMIAAGKVKTVLSQGVDNLYISAALTGEGHQVTVDIVGKHTRISKIVKDGVTLLELDDEVTEKKDNGQGDIKAEMTVEKILDFAETVDIERLAPIVGMQAEYNTQISNAGLTRSFGAEVGKTLISEYGDGIKTRARAKAAAGSDARMGGCELPVVINSGSGNQGMTVSLPVIEYAEYLGSGEEKMYRALAISNLVSIHIKSNIGDLSAFCGAVSAACGAGAGITYLHGGGLEEISGTINNTLANVSGIVCDGAKPACAAKIASAVDAAIMAHDMSMKGRGFKPGEGIVGNTVEETLKSVGYMGRVGMKETDIEILKLMTGAVELD